MLAAVVAATARRERRRRAAPVTVTAALCAGCLIALVGRQSLLFGALPGTSDAASNHGAALVKPAVPEERDVAGRNGGPRREVVRDSGAGRAAARVVPDASRIRSRAGRSIDDAPARRLGLASSMPSPERAGRRIVGEAAIAGFRLAPHAAPNPSGDLPAYGAAIAELGAAQVGHARLRGSVLRTGDARLSEGVAAAADDRGAAPGGHMIIVVTGAPDRRPDVEMTTASEVSPGYVRAAAYTPIGSGGGVLRQCALREDADEDIRTVDFGIAYGAPAVMLPIGSDISDRTSPAGAGADSTGGALSK